MRYRLRTLLIVLALGPPMLGLYLLPKLRPLPAIAIDGGRPLGLHKTTILRRYGEPTIKSDDRWSYWAQGRPGTRSQWVDIDFNGNNATTVGVRYVSR